MDRLLQLQKSLKKFKVFEKKTKQAVSWLVQRAAEEVYGDNDEASADEVEGDDSQNEMGASDGETNDAVVLSESRQDCSLKVDSTRGLKADIEKRSAMEQASFQKRTTSALSSKRAAGKSLQGVPSLGNVGDLDIALSASAAAKLQVFFFLRNPHIFERLKDTFYPTLGVL